jgi:tight adherence protein B
MIDFLLVLAILVGTGIAVMAVFLVIRFVVEQQRAFWRRRLMDPGEEETPSLLVAEAMPKEPTGWSDRIDDDFDKLIKQTGIQWSVPQTLGVIMLSGVVLAAALFLWRGEMWLMAGGLLLGVAVPMAVLLILRMRWRANLQAQLPDALFLLARSLRAGESLEQALETVADHGTRPLADEFRLGVEKIKLGLAVPAALRGMARRIDLPDFNVLVTAVTLHRTVGGNLTMLLDRVAASTRDRNLFRGYVLAATALSRVTGFFIAAAAPLLFIGYLLWQPDFINSFMQTPAGMRAMWMALGLEVVGAAWMYYLLRIDY